MRLKRERVLWWLIVLSLVAVFATIAVGVVVSTRVSEADRMISEWAVSVRTPALDTTFVLLTTVGNTGVMVVLVALASIAWLVWGQPRAAVVFAASMAGEYLIVETVKTLAGRVRPPGAIAIIATPSSYSFPSGHAFAGLVFFGLSALLVAAVTKRRAVARGALAIGFAVGLAVGASRVYLGVHWASDVLASWALGSAWLLLTWSLALKGRLAPSPVHPAGLSRPSAIAVSAALALAGVATILAAYVGPTG